ncbi:MAG TPA: Glu-tRNA(Gln) amidotransferase subunit GatE [Bacteroidales bacterium]|nr:Glu-tRNA(Gln) amidotransferase subunit GatE [Bacteroidales bacterium]
MKSIDPKKNFEASKKSIGYVNLKNAQPKDYQRIGFSVGLEVHQQLLTKEKLFCRCPAGIYQKPDEYDAELLRHMRPTLSELGTYDDSALMEFKTKKKIIYRISNTTACTYDIDDTPPFPINREALRIALEIALACKMNIVSETHIIRKPYLDGSIPSGFQCTALLGIEGEIELKNKKIRLAQLSIEEDSCREISDEGHTRIFSVDRMGIPMVEIVTYPDILHPTEVMEVSNYIRFLNRSTGKVRTGIGTGRQDVNVSCKGGTRIEIKGVAHTKWLPALSHNECFRQWALLAIKEKLQKRVKKENWKMQSVQLNSKDFPTAYAPIKKAFQQNKHVIAVNLPYFAGLLSHFTQPDKAFYDEYVHRLKVIACFSVPNMICSEDMDEQLEVDFTQKIRQELHSKEEDAQIIFWGPENNISTALQVIEERSLMAFDGVPKETRQSFSDGTTAFERVLPSSDRMYPDTDTLPITIDDKLIEEIKQQLPQSVSEIKQQLKDWEIPEDCHAYILSRNYFTYIQHIVDNLHYTPKFIGVFFGQKLKHLHGQYRHIPFAIQRLYELFAFLEKENIDKGIAYKMLKQLFIHPAKDFEAILDLLDFKRINEDKIVKQIPLIADKYKAIDDKKSNIDKKNSIMGQLKKMSLGNINLSKLAKHILP